MAATTRLTVDDLECLPENHEGDRHELIDGELVVTPAPITKHQDISMNLTLALGAFVRTRRLGKVYAAPSGVRLDASTLVIPDLHVVVAERLHIIGEKTTDGLPDLIIEILSPGTRRRDLTTKRALYARVGVPEYWIVDPDAQTVSVLTLTEGRYELMLLGGAGVIDSAVLPGLALTLEEVFADLT